MKKIPFMILLTAPLTVTSGEAPTYHASDIDTYRDNVYGQDSNYAGRFKEVPSQPMYYDRERIDDGRVLEQLEHINDSLRQQDNEDRLDENEREFDD